jgi:hypothetical protein
MAAIRVKSFMTHRVLHATPSPILRLAVTHCRPFPSTLAMSLKRKAGDQPASDAAKKSKQNA